MLPWLQVLYVALVLVGLVVIGYILYDKVYIQHFVVGRKVMFLAQEETAAFLRDDPDSYVKNLSPLDLRARRVGEVSMYLERISKSALDFTPEQKVRYTRAALQADAFFHSTRMDGLDTHAIANIPWVLAMTQGALYEDGLPHTRANIIFLSTDLDETPDSLVRTLIHEKIHLYQRLHPEEMMQLMERQGYKRWKQRLGEPRIRANPDVDPWIYVDPVSGEPMVATYSTDKPVSITDVVLDDAAFEHPYEKIAYEVAKRLNE